MKKIIYLVAVTTGLVCFNACQRPVDIDSIQEKANTNARVDSETFRAYTDGSVTGQVQLKNGMLCFKDAQSFMELDSVMHASDHAYRINFAERLQFESLLKLGDQLYSALSQATENVQYEKLLLNNKDIVRSDDGKIKFLFDLTSAWALNRQGLVSIGGRIHCFLTQKTLTGSTVEAVKASYQSEISTKNVKNNGAKLSAGPCDIYSRGLENSDHQRLITLDVQLTQRFISTGYDQYGETGNAQWSCYLLGSAYKKNVFGNYVLYDTDNYLNTRYYATIRYQNQYPRENSYTTYDRYVNKGQSYRYTSNIDDTEVLLTLSNARNDPNNQYNWHYQAAVYNDGTGNFGRYWTTGVPAGINIDCN